MLKNPRFWGRLCQIVLAPAILALGGLILDLETRQEKDSSQYDENKE